MLFHKEFQRHNVTDAGNEASSPTPRPQSRREAILEVWREFCAMSSMHGVRFLGDSTVGLIAKILWGVALTASAVALSMRSMDLIDSIYSSRTEIRVLSTRTALEDVPFPSIIFCPRAQIVRSRALQLLAEHLESKLPAGTFDPEDPNIVAGLNEMYEALMKYHYPYTADLRANAERIQEIFQEDSVFDSLDLEKFFDKAVPTCEEIFENCLWHGLEVSCCKVLQRQISHLGYCFAFNSLVTVPRRNCTASSPNDRGDNALCFLRHSATSGIYTGLTVTLKNSTDMVSESGGMMLGVIDPTSRPLSGQFHRIQFKRSRLTQIAATTVTTQALEEVRKIPLERRKCQFKEEPYGAFDTYAVEKSYSAVNCNIRCAALRLINTCKCKSHLVEPFLTGRKKCHCKPRCEDMTFITDILHKSFQTNLSLIDIFYYSGDGLLMYQRRLSLDTYSALVSFGGSAGLFLGCSVLSMAELMYYLGRAIAALISPKGKEWKDKSVSLPSISSLKVPPSPFPWYP